MLSPILLHTHRRAYHSEAGEDGALEYLLSAVGSVSLLSRSYVDVGAWDGRHLSNTYRLARAHGFAGVCVESDPARYEALVANMAGLPGTRCLRRRVEIRGPDALDAILDETPIAADFDVLSIDIDGDDYHVWCSLERFRPKIVVIELNFRARPGAMAINEPGAPFVWGVSGTGISPMRRLGADKGYGLVANVGCNALFVRGDVLSRIGVARSEHDAFTYEGFAWRELTRGERLQKGRFRAYRGCAALRRVLPRSSPLARAAAAENAG